jgi:hypothetical protein
MVTSANSLYFTQIDTYLYFLYSFHILVVDRIHSPRGLFAEVNEF